MKQWKCNIPMVLLFAIALQTQAQTPLTVGMNGYRDGDVITKQEIRYKSPGRNGSNVPRGISEMESVNDSYLATHTYGTHTDRLVSSTLSCNGTVRQTAPLSSPY